MPNSAHEEFETRLTELGVSRESVEELANQLLWRIGRTEEGTHVTVRVGLASSAAQFQTLPRLRGATDAELEEAVQEGNVRLEWVGPRLPGMAGGAAAASAVDGPDARRRGRRDARAEQRGDGPTEGRSTRRRVVRAAGEDGGDGGSGSSPECADAAGRSEGRTRSRGRRSGRSSRRVGGRSAQAGEGRATEGEE